MSARAEGDKRFAQIGPQVGAPPSLEQIPVDRLQVDAAYQRATDGESSRKIITGMVREWNWSLCQPLVVARRGDGGLFILDGQHRHQGAVQRGDIPFLPCVVLSSLDHAGEASTFVALNTRRQKLTEAEVFNGMLAAGDPDAKAVQQLLAETGWTIVRHSNSASYKPGELQCAPMLVRQLKRDGEAPVRFALTVLRAAYPAITVTVAASLLKALFDVFQGSEPGEHGDPFTTAALITAIGAARPTDWITRGLVRRERFPGLSQIGAIAECFRAAARGETPIGAIPVRARVSTPAPVPSTGHPANAARPAPSLGAAPMIRRPAEPQANPFGSSGKGWCDQCQSLRSREHAAACGGQFCSLRRHT